MTTATALASVVPPEAIEAPGDPDRWASLGSTPEAVVCPRTADEAAAVLAWASTEGVGVVPAASGRRLGPRRMSGRFLVVASDRLSGMEIYEPADVTFTAGAGTPMREIEGALRANDQWLPFDPPAVSDRSLGGLVASGASGPLWMGYGAVRNHVLGATLVTGDGRVLRLGGRVVKNVAGFDLLKPIIGGRGRLGFLTSVCMRAFPAPTADRSLTLASGSVDTLVGVALAVGTAPVMPVSSVLSIAEGGARAELRVRLHGAVETVDADQRTLEEHTGVRFDAVDGGRASSETTGDDAPTAATVLVATVLPSKISAAVAATETLGPVWTSIDTYAARLEIGVADFDPAAVRDLRGSLQRLGGALAVERAPDGADVTGLASEPWPAERTLASRVASVFDPEGVLWRGSE